MKLSKRTNTIILWLIAIALLVSMVIAFTPGTLFGGDQQLEGETALLVNDQPIRTLEIARLEQNPPFNAVQEGPLAEDLDLVLLDELVNQSLISQAASGVRVSDAEVRARVNEFREEQGVAGSGNDRGYLNLIAGAGYTDETFRALLRQQLQQERYLASLTEGIEVSDEEVQTYFEANRQRYTSEPRVTAREIVVADAEEANDLYERALAGEDFGALAREYSSERAEQGGALGAQEGESEPQPVTRVALPTAVAEAAFSLQGPGLTEPTEAGGVFHIVEVEAFDPGAPRPFEEVQEEVRADALAAKEDGAQEAALLEMRQNVRIESPESSAYSFDNPVVARVGEHDILAAELNRNTYLNPQLQQLINPSLADLLVNSVKPNVLEQLIDLELAYQGAVALGVPFVGSRAEVAESALGYVSREAEATDEGVNTYYEENQAFFMESPTADATRFNFSDEASAESFREALVSNEATGAEVIRIAAEAAGGSAEELGVVLPGTQPEALEAALFDFEGESMVPLAGEDGLEVSGVLRTEQPAADLTGGAMTGGTSTGGALTGGDMTGGAMTGGAAGPTEVQYVVLVATRVPARARPLDEVRPQVEQAVLNEQRNALQSAWLDERREATPVENLLVSAQGVPENLQTGGAMTGGAMTGGDALGAPESTQAESIQESTQTGGAQ